MTVSAEMIFAKNLLSIRERSHLTRKQLAERSHVTEQTIYLIEKFKTSAGLATVTALAEALQVEPIYFFMVLK